MDTEEAPRARKTCEVVVESAKKKRRAEWTRAQTAKGRKDMKKAISAPSSPLRAADHVPPRPTVQSEGDMDSFEDFPPNSTRKTWEGAVAQSERKKLGEWILVRGDKKKKGISYIFIATSTPSTPRRTVVSPASISRPRNYAQVVASPQRENYQPSHTWAQFLGAPLAKRARKSIQLGATPCPPRRSEAFSLDENSFPPIQKAPTSPQSSPKPLQDTPYRPRSSVLDSYYVEEVAPPPLKKKKDCRDLRSPLKPIPLSFDESPSEPPPSSPIASRKPSSPPASPTGSQKQAATTPTNQYGGGRKRKQARREEEVTRTSTPSTILPSTPPTASPKASAPPTSPPVAPPLAPLPPLPKHAYKNGTGPPTKDELEYFEKWTITWTDPKLYRNCPAYVEMYPYAMKLWELRKDPDLIY
ncbi:hypothetical protein CAEBREN_19489 [Caenorhabditis brenneri]|uniref:Uncharacterized protein n=1 Tax=Caenorhabditis brenneri TaxID=135651 RepID=G0N1J8_CAEBE|nr:hypothetical protein CAEBREN_19489 [Caenorhabditis brenneri]